ncbi:unnamed protein product [Musa acuminata subsp. malaccensis]|uniref:(wild Malaysian banana) hypothetical protein n=1 Tax=Musa acuminata subsp. malaccensis TaxID=214687 RepID=A0A8D7FGD3_MUSAM|nr:unnamed protein product [Musa acuminata subsp. malaccensis]
MSRWPGDWNCRSCQHFNFSRRSSCQNCGELRSSSDFPDHGCFGGGRGESLNGLGGSNIRPGDWRCACGGHNFASRSICHSCGAFKEDSAVGCFDGDDVSNSNGGRAEWKSGDWLCTRSGCNQHNFASRRECFRCKAPRGCGKRHFDQPTLI